MSWGFGIGRYIIASIMENQTENAKLNANGMILGFRVKGFWWLSFGVENGVGFHFGLGLFCIDGPSKPQHRLTYLGVSTKEGNIYIYVYIHIYIYIDRGYHRFFL